MNPLSGNATHVEAVAGNEYCTVELCGRLAQLVRAPPLHGGCRGFESLIAHLSFPRKISRSDSSDIPNYLACMSASRTRSRSHGFRQCFVKTSVNATDSFFDNVAFGVDARRGNRSITKKQQYGTAESNAIYTVITFAQIWNFMETSSSTASASKKGLESCDSKPLYERPTLAMRVEAGKTNTISGLCRMRADGCRSSHR